MGAGRSGVTRLRSTPLLLALVLARAFLLPGVACAQLDESGVGIWELPRPTMDAMLRGVPGTDAARYARLRKAFTDFRCTGDSLRTIAAGQAPTDRNLLCILPGDDRQPIVVAADWPQHPTHGDLSTGWPEAIALPMLYHALRAQPHHFTFIFIELGGQAGEEHFFRALRNGDFPHPVAFVALDGLGLGPLRFSIDGPGHNAVERNRTTHLLNAIAWKLASLEGFSGTRDSRQSPGEAARSSLADGAKDLPRVLFSSDFTTSASAASFRQQHDFIAFYLAAIDKQLNPMAQLPE